METGRKKFYITTAIDYVNGRPHVGHALEKIQADVVARYHRQKGERVFFLTGTDEHGAKIARAAEHAGQDPQAYCDQNSAYFKSLKEALNLSLDDFIRTTDRVRHWPGALKLWSKLAEAGDLYKKTYRGLYCVGHEAFVTEKDLVDGKCRDHQKEPEVIDEENWFFRLSRYGKVIGEKITAGELLIVPESRKNEILSLINAGLEDVSFSRPIKDLSWGIPVPNDAEHVMYVWCDALSNYITAIGYGRDEEQFAEWWPADMHVIGKDILRFHAAIWPGMLLAAGLPLPKAIFVHGFMTVDGEKMSKTVGNIIDPFGLTKTYGTDPVRYYLLREIPSGEDGDFSHTKFADRYNGDLANGIGNLTARVATLGEKISPVSFYAARDMDRELRRTIETTVSRYEAYMQEVHLNEALAAAWELISHADRYINEKKPWGITDRDELVRVMGNAAYLVSVIAGLIEPFLPETAEKIKEQISVHDSVIEIKKGGNLFPRLA